jgi:hypothetical protein
LKKILALVLLLAFTAQCFNNTFIVLSFYFNQKYIASELCENRHRPMLHCNGKCLLAKKIKQEENKDQQNPERKLENKNEIISSQSFFVTVLYISSQEKYKISVLSESRVTDYSCDIFRPPCA